MMILGRPGTCYGDDNKLNDTAATPPASGRPQVGVALAVGAAVVLELPVSVGETK